MSLDNTFSSNTCLILKFEGSSTSQNSLDVYNGIEKLKANI